jgi:hypothetical protein
MLLAALAGERQLLDDAIHQAIRPVATALRRPADAAVRSGPVVLMSCTVMATMARVRHEPIVVVGPEIAVNVT